MKKATFKKAGAAVLSMAMLLSFGAIGATSVSATTTVPITNNSNLTVTYKYIKIADSTERTGYWEYSNLNAKFNTKLSLNSTNGSIKYGATDLGTVATNSATARDIATDLASVVAAADLSDIPGSGLANGYYLLVDTAGNAAPVLLDIRGEASKPVVAKAAGVPFNKKITAITAPNSTANVISDADGDLTTSTIVGVDGKTGIVEKGSVVTYQLDTKLPVYSDVVKDNAGHIDITDFVITDIPESSLTINTSTIKVYIDGVEKTKDTDYTLNPIAAMDATTYASYTGAAKSTRGVTSPVDATAAGFTIAIKDDVVLAKGGKDVKVTFNATVASNDTLDVNADSNNNTAQLDYNNDFYTAGAKFEDDGTTPKTPGGDGSTPDNPNDSKKSEADVFTTLYTVNKAYDDRTDTSLKATFAIYKKGETTPIGNFTANADGTVYTFSGLGVGEYVIKETAPTGYVAAPDTELKITTAEDGKTLYAGSFKYNNTDTASVSLTNHKGQTLPGTGGMGTILFTVGGAAIIFIAGAMFVLYMKKRRVEE